MFVTMAIHHPNPRHTDDFLAFMAGVEATMSGTPGLISIESLRDIDAPRLIAIGRWESADAADAGLPLLMAIGGRDPDWTVQPDEMIRLAP